MAPRSVQSSLHSSPQSVSILYKGLPSRAPLKIAIFAGLTTVTDRQRDHATRSVAVGHIYLHSTAVWPKK